MTDQPTKNTHFPWEAMQGYQEKVRFVVPNSLSKEWRGG